MSLHHLVYEAAEHQPGGGGLIHQYLLKKLLKFVLEKFSKKLSDL